MAGLVAAKGVLAAVRAVTLAGVKVPVLADKAALVVVKEAKEAWAAALAAVRVAAWAAA